MKKYLLLVLIVIGIYVFLGSLPDKKALESPSKESSDGYVSTLMDIKNDAERDIEEAVEKENNKINEALMEKTEPVLVEKESKAIIKTSAGDIEIELFVQDAPQTVGNFLKLSSEGFYNETAFHRVIKGFMVQGGDPFSKEKDWSKIQVGTGGPGYTIPAEIKLKNERGTIATARQGDQVNPKKDSSGSQFFINTVDNSFLNGQYTVFGTVIKGMEVVDKIENSQTNQMDQPLERIIIKSIEIL